MFLPNIRVIFRLIFATIIAYLRHAIPSFKIATPHSQYLRHYLCGANHNRASPRHCSLRSPTTAPWASLPLGIASARPPPLPLGIAPLAATASTRPAPRFWISVAILG